MKTIQITDQTHIKKIRFHSINVDKLKGQIGRQYINKELILKIEQILASVHNADKLQFLCYLKKVIIQTPRKPDPDHYQAFKDEYDSEGIEIAVEQRLFDPVKWLEAEIEYITQPILSHYSKEEVQNELNKLQEIKRELGKDLLTFKDVLALLHLSKTTLNRRIADGMPCYKQGRFVFFVLSEITEWIKKDAA
jgi:predicted DNA-binding transcriptional regulator AlpA